MIELDNFTQMAVDGYPEGSRAKSKGRGGQPSLWGTVSFNNGTQFQVCWDFTNAVSIYDCAEEARKTEKVCAEMFELIAKVRRSDPIENAVGCFGGIRNPGRTYLAPPVSRQDALEALARQRRALR